LFDRLGLAGLYKALMSLKAIRNRVIAKILPQQTKKGGIYLPENSEGDKCQYFEILSVGPIAQDEYPLLQEGVVVLATKYAYTDEKLQGECVYCLDSDAILCVVHEECVPQ
jgi:co-chaperonin GroES (HSP10)